MAPAASATAVGSATVTEPVIVAALVTAGELPPRIAPRPEHQIAAPTEVPRAAVTGWATAACQARVREAEAEAEVAH